MASEKRIYPQMSPKSWFIIRKKFKSTIPPQVTTTYLETIGIPKDSVRSTVLPTLRRVGLIDEDGKPTDLVKNWRDDASYQDTCKLMIKILYPEELIAIAPDKDSNRQEIITWFGRDTGAGESAVKKMTGFYIMLLEANPSEAVESVQVKGIKSSRTGEGRNAKVQGTQNEVKVKQDNPPGTPKDTKQEIGRNQLAIHFNIQIHIHPEADENQIEVIFQSMEKHLKGFIE